MHICARTDLGKVRQNNEDAIAFDESIGIAVLADGMGGLNAGEIASDRAVGIAMEHLREGLCAEDADLAELLRTTFREANHRVFELSNSRHDYQGMGTTLVAAVARPDGCVTAHVGDSRAYFFSKGRLSRITSDHSLVHELVLQGVLTTEEARASPNRNIITRAIGIEPEVRCDINRVVAGRGDLVLLCSDGLTDMLTDEEIGELCVRHANEPERLIEVLIADANARGGFDNISVIAVDW